MASSRRDEEGPERKDHVEGAAESGVPKTTRSDEESAASPWSTTQWILKLIDWHRLRDAFQVDPKLASDIILRRVVDETNHKSATTLVANVLWLLKNERASGDANTIFDLILNKDEESLRKAFEIHSARASHITVAMGGASRGSTLASLLRKQISNSLYIAEALTCIAMDPRDMSEAIDFVLREGAVLAGLGRTLVIRSLGSLDPLVVMPNLVRFLRVTPGDAVQDVLDTIEGQILSLERRGFQPHEAQIRRDLVLSQLTELLNDDQTLGRLVKDAVVGIILRHANDLGSGLDVLIGKLAQTWRVSIEEAGWRLCSEVLTNPQSKETEWRAAVEWYLGRRHKEDRWRVYVAIFERSTEPEHRLIAVRRLGSGGPTATGPPLPGDVAELRNWLLDLSERAENQKLRDEAKEALNQNIARGKEEVPPTQPPSLREEVRTRELGTVDAGPDTPERGGKRPTTVSEMPELVEGTLPARPTAEVLLTDLEQTQTTLAELHAPIIEKLRLTLKRLYEVKSLGSYTENAKAAAMVYQLAKSCGVDLTYNGERVALGCVDREGYKAGGFRLRTFSGKPKIVYDRKDFPPLELTPSNGPGGPSFTTLPTNFPKNPPLRG